MTVIHTNTRTTVERERAREIECVISGEKEEANSSRDFKQRSSVLYRMLEKVSEIDDFTLFLHSIAMFLLIL